LSEAVNFPDNRNQATLAIYPHPITCSNGLDGILIKIVNNGDFSPVEFLRQKGTDNYHWLTVPINDRRRSDIISHSFKEDPRRTG
jgi:hypothetical protein